MNTPCGFPAKAGMKPPRQRQLEGSRVRNDATATGAARKAKHYSAETPRGEIDTRNENSPASRAVAQLAGHLRDASAVQVSTTESGFSEIDTMPSSASQAAKSGWSLGPWPQMPTYL